MVDDLREPGREWVRKHLTDKASAGILKALNQFPTHVVPRIQLDSQSPWAFVDAFPGPSLAVWLETGEVYEVGPDGAVDDDPIFKLEEGNPNS